MTTRMTCARCGHEYELTPCPSGMVKLTDPGPIILDGHEMAPIVHAFLWPERLFCPGACGGPLVEAGNGRAG
jgi:hypothetical protein